MSAAIGSRTGSEISAGELKSACDSLLAGNEDTLRLSWCVLSGIAKKHCEIGDYRLLESMLLARRIYDETDGGKK